MNSRVKLLIITSSSCLVFFLLLGAVLGHGADSDQVYRHFAVFTDVLHRIKSEYVEEPDLNNVTLGAVNGLLEAIDPYASYLSEDQYNQYRKRLRSQKAGLGLVLSRKVGYVSVVDTVPGSPADKAGIATGDIIETIGGVATRDMPLAYAEILLCGKAGSTVDLTVLRVRQSAEPQEFQLTMAKVATPEVRSQLISGDTGHISVRSLEKGRTTDVAKHVKKVTREGASRLILDLRRCATGDPEEGLAVADLFLDEGLMAYLEGQRTPRQSFLAESSTTISRLPMAVVTNRGTARGGELAAIALLENKRAEVVGERSYGDAAMRKAVPLDDGSAVILSTAKYYSATGKAVQDTGVTPTVVSIARDPLPAIDEEPRIEPRPEPSLDEDVILQKAIEVLTKGAATVAQDDPVKDSINPNKGPGDILTPLNIPKKPDR
ncbi:MAG: PDZ domain-containing protein [bacterium]|nr:PDZ domain-containing protein [bacterium]